MPIYCATKAFTHAFNFSLRYHLKILMLKPAELCKNGCFNGVKSRILTQC